MARIAKIAVSTTSSMLQLHRLASGSFTQSYAGVEGTTFALTASQLLQVFTLPVLKNHPLKLQRNTQARIAAGCAKHVIGCVRPATQALFMGVLHKGQLFLLDGYHRLFTWHANGSPFTHVQLTVFETDEESTMISLYESVDNRASTKGGKDDLWAVFGLAGFAEQVKSQQMQMGRGLVSVMNRFLGVKGGLEARANSAAQKEDAILLADDLLNRLPRRKAVKQVKDVFGAGELLAVLQTAQRYVDSGDVAGFRQFKMWVLRDLEAYIRKATGHVTGKPFQVNPSVEAMFADYEAWGLAYGLGRSAEAPISQRAEYLKNLLEAHMSSIHRRSVRVSKKAA